MSINVSTMSGKLIAEPHLVATPSGTYIIDLAISVMDRRWDRETEAFKSVSTIWDVSLRGKRALALEPYLHKGDKVSVTGRLSKSKTDDGRVYVKLLATDIDLMSGAKYPQNEKQEQEQPEAPASPYAEEDIPF